MEDLALDAIDGGWTWERFRETALQMVQARNQAAQYREEHVATPGSIAPTFEGRTISLREMICAHLGEDGRYDPGPYRELSKELESMTGHQPRHGGLLFPIDLRTLPNLQYRTLSASTATDGARIPSSMPRKPAISSGTWRPGTCASQ